MLALISSFRNWEVSLPDLSPDSDFDRTKDPKHGLPNFPSQSDIQNGTSKVNKTEINIAFELRCWRRLLRVPWTARISNQSILKEINPEYSLEGLGLRLQYSGHLIRKANSLEKTLMLEKTEGRRRRG